MDVFIRVLNGPDAGLSFKVKPGIKLGRKDTDFIIKDNGASSLHAKIRAGDDGRFYLVDSGSKNGTRINGTREDLFELIEGLVFTIGNTNFEVVKNLQSLKPSAPPERLTESSPTVSRSADLTPKTTGSNQTQGPSVPKSKVNLQKSAPAVDSLIDIKVKHSWHETLEDFSQESLAKIKNKILPASAFNPALRLSFIRGAQTDTVWSLGYGPRRIGSHEYDLVIFEPEAPPLCFELLPTDEGPLFKTGHTKKVQLNGKPIEKALLQSGDLININNTTIKVELVP